MRLPGKNVRARTTVVALALGVVGVLVTALPAAASGTVSSFVPLCGVPGTTVTITGVGFTGSTGVQFGAGATQAAAPSSDTSITTTVPAGAATGSLTVQPGGVPSAASFTFVAAAAFPTVNAASGAIGSTVTLIGTNLCGTTQVHFGALTVTPTNVLSATSLTVVVPVGATTGTLTVTNPAGTSLATTFTVTSSAPTITSFSPTSGNVGTSVVITGTNFSGATSVRFNGSTATYTINSATQITATVPSAATTGTIQVTGPGGTGTSATSFTVTGGTHSRSVTFGISDNSRVSGRVNVSDGYAACRSYVPVVIQKQKGGDWKWVDTTSTNGNGSYKTYIPPSNNTLRAKVNKLTLVNGVVCGGDSSPTHQG